MTELNILNFSKCNKGSYLTGEKLKVCTLVNEFTAYQIIIKYTFIIK